MTMRGWRGEKHQVPVYLSRDNVILSHNLVLVTFRAAFFKSYTDDCKERDFDNPGQNLTCDKPRNIIQADSSSQHAIPTSHHKTLGMEYKERVPGHHRVPPMLTKNTKKTCIFVFFLGLVSHPPLQSFFYEDPCQTLDESNAAFWWLYRSRSLDPISTDNKEGWRFITQQNDTQLAIQILWIQWQRRKINERKQDVQR